ncbi:ribulose-phosphate 3 epimerase family protein [Mycobacterium xenopi 3993]|nr:ribulose-phosphate 3 epimerase family protein [Mycobacterium xenopi 3993]
MEPYLDILKDFDTFLVMSVEPGFGGQDFMPEVLGKVRKVRKMVDSGELTVLVEIDGGINADTIEQAAEAGVDCFVAGSAVYGADDPAAAVEALRRQARPRHRICADEHARGHQLRRRYAAGRRARGAGQGQHLSQSAGRRGHPGPGGPSRRRWRHRTGGSAHAEIVALRRAGGLAAGGPRS